MDKKAILSIGIIGGGQLGRMLTEAAIRLGYDVKTLDPTPNCPASQVGALQILGSWKDPVKIKELIDQSDFVTIEIEHIDVDTLEKYQDKHINPKPSTIRLIQDKYNQKVFLAANNLATAEFCEIADKDQANEVLAKYGGKMILKSKTDAYDGRGNEVVSSPEDLSKALKRFTGYGLYAEKLVDFKKELAVMVAKDFNGKIVSFPVVETIHKRNICEEVFAPAQISEEVASKAKNLAEQVVSKLDGAGIYGVELFLAENNNVLINEIAPRVHNSGHYTMDGCNVSQFEQNIRAVSGMNLVEPSLDNPTAMVNILGERNGPVALKGTEEVMQIPGVSVYLYGKSPTKIDRKMGHINATASTIEEAIENARKARKAIDI